MNAARRRAMAYVLFVCGTSIAQLGTSAALAQSPAEAQAAAERPAYALAQEAYDKLEYEEANRLAARAIERGGLTQDQLARTVRILAITHAVMGHEEDAQKAFILVLMCDPDSPLDPNLGPRVQAPYYEARRYWRNQPLRAGVEATVSPRRSGQNILSIKTRDPLRKIKNLTVRYRWDGAGGDSAPSTEVFAATGERNVDLPPPPLAATRLDYSVQATDERDNVLFDVGTTDSPKTAVIITDEPRPAPPASEKSSSIFRSPVFWAIAGGVVAAGSVGVFLATRSSHTSPASSSTLTPSLVCGTELCR